MSFSEHGRGQPDTPDPEEQFWAVLHGEIAKPADISRLEAAAYELAESMNPEITQEQVVRAEATGAEMCVTTTEYGDPGSAGKQVTISLGRRGNFKSPFELCFKLDGTPADLLACNNAEEISESQAIIEEILTSTQYDEAVTIAMYMQAYLLALAEKPSVYPDLYEGWGPALTDVAKSFVSACQGEKAVELREWSFGLPDNRTIDISTYKLRGYPVSLDEPVPGESDDERQVRKDMPQLEIQCSFEDERKTREYLLTQSGERSLEVTEAGEEIDEYDPDQLLIVDDEVFDSEERGVKVDPPRAPDVKQILELLRDVAKAEAEGMASFIDEEE